MGKHGGAFQKKQDNKEQKRRIRTKKSIESPEITEKHRIDNRLITGTPFLPRMKEHADILAGIKFTTQRNNFIQQLHRTYGSRYVQRLVTSLNVQAKLTVSDPNDIYEQEADRIADNVTRTINSPAQRQPEEEEELLQGKFDIHREAPEEEEELQMRPKEDHDSIVADSLEKHINQTRGGGYSLSENIREPMEQAFRADFSGVRVHTNAESDALNKQLNAKAFTTGQDIFFREGEYSPGSTSGQHLIAHELTHVVQQSGGQVNQGNTSQAINSEIDMLKQEKNAVSVQSESTAIQRDWEPTAGDLKFLNSMHPSALVYYKMSDYLRYSGLYNMLEGFAQSEYSEENIHFLKDVYEYGETPEQAEDIWHKYLMKGAWEELNLTGATMEKLRDYYEYFREMSRINFEEKTGESGKEMLCPVCKELVLNSSALPMRLHYEEAYKEITKLVEDNTLTRFKEKAREYTRA